MSDLTVKFKVRFTQASRKTPKVVQFMDGAKDEELTPTSPASLPISSPPPPTTEAVTNPGVSRIARMLALASHIEHLVDQGAIKDYAHAAMLLGITRLRMTQVMNLLTLPVAV